MTTPTADLTRHTTVRDGVTRWTLTGPAGSVVLSAYGIGGAAGIDYHWRTPLFDGDTPGTCTQVDYPCYGDGGSTAARRVVAQWRHGGYDDAVVWAELERWYREQVARDQADAQATPTAPEPGDTNSRPAIAINRPDGRGVEICVDGRVVASANYDDHGWSGIDAVENAALAVARAFGVEPSSSI